MAEENCRRLVFQSLIGEIGYALCGQHTYVSARRLFWVIRELQAVANGEPAHTRDQ
jgi:hypothetical protein